MLNKHVAKHITHNTYMAGASLRAWQEIFPLANITALDINADAVALARGRRIETHVPR